MAGVEMEDMGNGKSEKNWGDGGVESGESEGGRD